jgi:alkylated DNA repair dioxygenase AlkB
MELFNQESKPKERVFQKFPLKDGEVWLMPNFMPDDKAKNYYDALLSNINWRQEEIKMYGKTHPVPRKTAWYGYPDFNYKYSGIMCNPEPWTKELMDIKKVIEHFLPGENFNSVLLNLYRNQQDSMGWHSDDEKELGDFPFIASLSLGSSRIFQLKHKVDKLLKGKIELSHGSLLCMGGPMQSFWQHAVPKSNIPCGPRINLTFRQIKKV